MIALLDEKSDLWFNLQPPGCQEIDVLLVHAAIGAFVIEVKPKPLSMFVHYDLERCEFTDDGRVRPPLKQAHWAMNKLRTFLGDVGIARPPFMVAAAAFPRVRREEMVARFSPSGIAGRVMQMHFDAGLFDDDLASPEVLADRFRWISRNPGMQRPPQHPNDSIPSSNQIADLIEATTGRGSSIPGSTEPTRKPQFVAVPGRASKDSVARYLKPAMRAPVVLNGHPGTGKTQALLDIAVAHAETGRQVLFTCYNKVLASAIRSSLGVRGVPDSVRQHLFVTDVFDIKAGLKPRGAVEDDLGAYEGSFGTICVDEAQDMNGSLVDFVERLASPDAEWFFADGEGQELYSLTGETFAPASRQLENARRQGIQQQLNRQFRFGTLAYMFAQGAYECGLDSEKIQDWVKKRPPPRVDEAQLDIGGDSEGGLPLLRTLDIGAASDRKALVTAYAAEIQSELEMLSAIGATGDLMITVPKLNDQHGLVVDALKSLEVPYLDQVQTDNRRRSLPDGFVRLVTVHSARGVGATRVLMFGPHDHRFGGTKKIPPLTVNRNTAYIALTRAKHGMRIVALAGQPASEFQQFVRELAHAYGGADSDVN